MRPIRLLLVVLPLLAGATASSQQVRANKSETASPKSDYVRPWASRDLGAPSRDSRNDTSRSVRNGLESTIADETCLTLHTLVVARDDEQSESTHLVAQHTCTPTRQFQIKSAVAEPSPQK